MKKLLLLAIIPLAFISCGKSGNVVPSVPVNFSASITDPRMAALNARGGFVLVGGGVAGLIIYREPDGSYASYDRCSTVNPGQHNAVNVDPSGFTATDPVSGAMFSMSDGSPVKAPATKSLRSYNVSVSNFEIFVSN